jgi:hypothetical protein
MINPAAISVFPFFTPSKTLSTQWLCQRVVNGKQAMYFKHHRQGGSNFGKG